jgi:plastocyanin
MRQDRGSTTVRRLAACAVVAPVLALGGFALAASSTITLGSTGPTPASLTIGWGDTVSFVNGDSEAHVVTISRLEASSPSIPPGGTFTQAFDGRGGNYFFRQLGTRNFNGNIALEVKGRVTISANATVVPFGRSVTLRGTSPYPGTPVVIEQRHPGGSSEWADLRTLTAGGDGAWSTAVRPATGRQYRATVAAKQLRSASVAISLTPLIRITGYPRRVKAGRPATVSARITPAVAATGAELERWDTRRKSWSRVASSPVRRGRVTLRWPEAEKGRTRVRVSVRRGSLASGFEPSASPAVVVTGA